MKRFWTETFCSCILMALCLSACSKEPTAPAVKAPDKPLVEVVHDAVKFYAEGGKSFTPPKGIVIETGKVKGEKGAVNLEFIGFQQRQNTMAAITFKFPATWFSSEKEKLNGLEAEAKELTSCAQRLAENQQAGADTSDKDACRMEEVTVNNLPGITIISDKAPHIRMTTLAAQ